VILLSHLITALAYAGAAFLFGLLLGERGELGVVQYAFATVIPVATAILAFVSRREGRGYVLATGAAMLLGLILGWHQFDEAWSDCNARAGSVRSALIAYHGKNDGYPARLEELGVALPCRAGLRKTILHYLSNERGFRLWYTNDAQTIVLTASEKSSAPRSR
jgi:hypothetical protein